MQLNALKPVAKILSAEAKDSLWTLQLPIETFYNMKNGGYAVIFSSKQSADVHDYGRVAEQIAERASSMPGFIRMESVHDADQNGITVCYWESLQAINDWKQDIEHQKAQKEGMERWYEQYRITVAKIEYEYSSSEKNHGRGIS